MKTAVVMVAVIVGVVTLRGGDEENGGDDIAVDGTC